MPGYPCCCDPPAPGCNQCSQGNRPTTIDVALAMITTTVGSPSSLNCANSDCPSLNGTYQNIPILEDLAFPNDCLWQGHFEISDIFRRHVDDPDTGTGCTSEYNQMTIGLRLPEFGNISASVLLGQAASFPQTSWVDNVDLYEIHFYTKAWDNFDATDDCCDWLDTNFTWNFRTVSHPPNHEGFYACEFGLGATFKVTASGTGCP